MTAEKITQGTEGLNVPNEPIIPFIIGDGIGPDIWKAASRVIDAAVEKAYNGEKRIEWKEVLAGQKAFDTTGEWAPKIKKMIPSYGESLIEDEKLMRKIRKQTSKDLELGYYEN
ncbi:isocitrate/isopropylmalate family dehydrogenase, partial [Staphylococcus aureus]|uniref:isocitrate/isopropylmalate family dehydrogenase n=1 Tax=Staphylococcus aureus TaxID=1280 RepID=UPI00215F66B3